MRPKKDAKIGNKSMLGGECVKGRWSERPNRKTKEGNATAKLLLRFQAYTVTV